MSGWNPYMWRQDGHPHVRDKNGTCGTCGASKREYHYRCLPHPCTCATDPYNCPQGRALVQAIHDRLTNQGDQ